jgi:hypothetical protein
MCYPIELRLPVPVGDYFWMKMDELLDFDYQNYEQREDLLLFNSWSIHDELHCLPIVRFERQKMLVVVEQDYDACF